MESRVPQHIPGVSSSLMSQPLLDSRVPYGRLQHLTIYPLDKIKSTHVENDYIDSPAVVSQQPPSQKAPRRVTWVGQGQENFLGANHNLHHNHQQSHLHQDSTTHPWITFSGRPSSISSSSSTSSDQRLLDHAAPTPVSKALSSSCTSKSLDLKSAQHLVVCEACGKCRCTECTLPRTLPSCWVCNQECLCSAQSLVDTATCMCLVKGIFYHCTEDEDDEGSCADKPCSCSQAHCCARWSFMTALSFVLPCLVCYLPAVGLAKLGQKCYDKVSRPGCRCKNLQGPTNVCKKLELCR
uniref:Uncharacterized protein n=1 Tax=Periophthalmus magnuspinnatus TaxID=409849 RepID=A0A3B4BB33_9GOBI